MNRKPTISAALLFFAALPLAHAASPSVPVTISPVTTLLGTLPVVGPTVANVIGLASHVVVGVPVVGPVFGGVFGAPPGAGLNLPGLPSTPGLVSGLPVVGPLLEGTLLGGQ